MLDRPALHRILQDRLRAEIAALRGGAAAGLLPAGDWPESLPLGADGLGADSLELLALGAAVNEMFHLHESGIEDLLLARRRFGDWLDLIVQAWQIAASRTGAPGRMSFNTSGSTGQPKRCPHRLSDLAAEAAEHAARLRPRRILSAVPCHHIYGFIFAVLLPRAAGCEVIDLRARLPAAGDFAPGDVIVSFPDHWRFLARSLERLPAVTGVSSTAPLPGGLARDLRARGLARLVEIYGATETAGIGWRDDPDAPFRLLDRWAIVAAPDGAGVLRLAGPDGRAVATQDDVVMAGGRGFHVRGRRDGAVQVGGVNVYPARVAARLEAHPLVRQARVRLAPLAEGGRLKALVVPRDPTADPAAVRQALAAWIAAELPAPEQPRALTIAAALPRDALGKTGDWVPEDWVPEDWVPEDWAPDD